MEQEQCPALIAAFGNPLWDICVTLPDKNVLSQFNLADDSSKEVAALEFESLLRAVQDFPKKACPGGAALNTLRIFQWLMGQQKSSVYFGSIGKDNIGEQLSLCVSEAGVDARFKIRPTSLTGSSICLIFNSLRTLVAHLGAANIYSPEDLTEEEREVITRVKLVYIENFFFIHSAEVIWDVIKLCKIHGVAIAFNLSGSYLFEHHTEDIASVVECVNIVIGNESEFHSFAQACGWGDIGIDEVADIICRNGIQGPSHTDATEITLKNLQELKKVVVITRGHRPVLCATEGKAIFMTPVLLPTSDIKDTTGAGDAFVAGLLKGFMLSLPIKRCIQLGCYASREIIQHIGCSPPSHAPLTMKEIEEAFALNLESSGK